MPRRSLQLAALGAGTLDPADHAAALDHVAGCARCRKEAGRLGGDGGVQSLGVSGLDAGRYGWIGFVATPWGLVGIPTNRSDVLLFHPGSAEARPMPVLLSPYFNKL